MWADLYNAMMEAAIRYFTNLFPPKLALRDLVNFLQLQVESEKREKRQLIEYIMELNKREEKEVEIDYNNFKPLNQRIPFHVTRARLEHEDREKLRVKKQEMEMVNEERKSTEQLEKELLVSD